MRDLYSVLGVARDADQATIRKAYKKLARQFHPDLNKDAGADERFKEINAAYEVLGEEDRRAYYDEFGEVSLKPGFNADEARQWKRYGGFGGAGGGGGWRPGSSGPVGGDFGWGGDGGYGGGVSMDDLLGMFGRRTQTRARPAAQRGPDIETTLQVGLVEALRGTQQLVLVRRPATCRTCSGEGGSGRSSCGKCAGSGRVVFGGSMQIPCDGCGGSGSVFQHECATCAGTGRVMDEERLKVKIPAAVDDGAVVRLRGKGGEGKRGGVAGDLLLTIELRAHPALRRVGADLELDVPITVAEAVDGARIEVPTLAGRVRVTVPPGANNGQRLRLRGKGVVSGDQAGDLYLVLRPTVPKGGDDELRLLAEKMNAFYDGDVRADLVL